MEDVLLILFLLTDARMLFVVLGGVLLAEVALAFVTESRMRNDP